MKINKGFAYAVVQYGPQSPIVKSNDGSLAVFSRLRDARKWRIQMKRWGWPIIRLEIWADGAPIWGNGKQRRT